MNTGRRASRAPKKHLGQHFLTAPSYAARIAEEIPAGHDDIVVEIGPGTGALTFHLARRFPNLHCVEKDTELLPRLLEKLDGAPCTVHNADALTFDFGAIGESIHVVGNLPYNVAAMIIRHVFFFAPGVKSCTFMVQREVAERIAARPHSKRMGFLSVFCQFFGAARVLFLVPPGAFFPRPDVDSAVVQVCVRPDVEASIPRARWNEFFMFVDSGYRMRRKKLSKSLRAVWPQIDFESAMIAANIPALSRPEDLAVDDWVRLFGGVFP